jgi:hypothetical protein
MHSLHLSRRTTVGPAIAACVALTFATAGGAAVRPSSSTRSGPLHGRVPAAQVAIFSVLKHPAVKHLPKRVSRALALNRAVRQLGIDLTQARRVGTASKPFYLLPGARGICLVLADGSSACTGNLASVASDGLAVDVANPTTNSDGTVDPTGDITALGLAADGFTAATVTTDSGATATGAITSNSYVIHTNGAIVRTTFTGPGRDPVTTP